MEKNMEHLKMQTKDMANENFEKLAALFPNCVTESVDKDGNPVRAIDKDLLAQEINGVVVEGQKERYQFNWPGKRDAIRTANAPTTMTLRPCKEESVDFDNTQNLYIEGDNLEVLKLLQNNYLGEVKMIYIDPPYNTGSDFVYNDDFKQDSETFLETSGMFDEDGNMTLQNFEKNSESNGRFHTDWLNMMYPRLKVARNLLKREGVICVSISDNEVENLKKMMNEIYGERNFEGHIHWRRRHNQPNDRTKMLGLVAEHILVYSKDKEYLKSVGVGKIDLTGNFSNPDNDPRGPWATKPWKVGSDQNGSRYIITTPTGVVYDEEWMGDEQTFNQLLADGRIQFPDSGNGSPRKKYYKTERAEEGQCATNWWSHKQFGHNQGGNDCLTELFDGVKNVFSNPKPIELLRGLLQISNVKESDIVLDFFSGSSSMAHAVIKMNADDDVNAKFIMIQLPENLDETKKSADTKQKKQLEVAINFLDTIGKPHLITEIGKERIRRAGNKIKEENGEKAANLDIGFRVLKLAESNMNDVYYKPADIDQGFLDKLESNIKKDRTPMDLLFQVMLECDLPLSSKIEERQINGKQVFFVNDKELVACFDEKIDEATITEIAKQKPYYFIMRDSSLATDNVADNFEQLFNAYSKDTIRKVL